VQQVELVGVEYGQRDRVAVLVGKQLDLTQRAQHTTYNIQLCKQHTTCNVARGVQHATRSVLYSTEHTPVADGKESSLAWTSRWRQFCAMRIMKTGEPGT
jgi:hypothetical protein